jgi:hypothetical protein
MDLGLSGARPDPAQPLDAIHAARLAEPIGQVRGPWPWGSTIQRPSLHPDAHERPWHIVDVEQAAG